MVIKIKVELRPTIFERLPFRADPEDFGSDFLYKDGAEFCEQREKARVFGALLNSFKKDSLPIPVR